MAAGAMPAGCLSRTNGAAKIRQPPAQVASIHLKLLKALRLFPVTDNTMPCYVYVEMRITDPGWVADYVREVSRQIAAHGGRYLARTNQVEQLEGEGDRPAIIGLVEFPSKADAQAFYHSDAYRPFRESRIKGASSRLLLIEGEDMMARR